MTNVSIAITLPLRIVSEANSRGSWHAGAKRANMQRGTAAMALRADCITAGLTSRYLIITLTRIAHRRLDTDNLQRALKAVRDGVADALGIDDGDARLEWRYEQRCQGITMPGTNRGYGVHICIEPAK